MNNCNARKFWVSEANVWKWKQHKEIMINVNTQKCISETKHGCFQDKEPATELWA